MRGDGANLIDAGHDVAAWNRTSEKAAPLVAKGATFAAIAQNLPELGLDARVLGFSYDTGERYLSVPDSLPEEQRPGGFKNQD